MFEQKKVNVDPKKEGGSESGRPLRKGGMIFFIFPIRDWLQPPTGKLPQDHICRQQRRSTVWKRLQTEARVI